MESVCGCQGLKNSKRGLHSTFTRIQSLERRAYLGTFFSWVSHGASDTWIPLRTTQRSLATTKYSKAKEKANEGGARTNFPLNFSAPLLPSFLQLAF